MPLRLNVEDYLGAYRGSLQERDVSYEHTLSRLTRDVAEQARSALSRASGGSRTYVVVTGTTIDVRSIREEAENAPVDLKPGLLYGPSSRISKKGVRYTVVPFRKRTPGRGKGGLATLPRDIYRAALAGQAITPTSEMGMRFQRTGYGGEEWGSGPFANLTKYPQGSRGSRYYAFRTVSENSAPLSWIRPPFLQKAEVTEGVQQYMSGVIPELVEQYLGQPDFEDDLYF